MQYLKLDKWLYMQQSAILFFLNSLELHHE